MNLLSEATVSIALLIFVPPLLAVLVQKYIEKKKMAKVYKIEKKSADATEDIDLPPPIEVELKKEKRHFIDYS